MDRPRRILGFVGQPMNGVSYARFHQPFRHLSDLGFELVTLGERLQLERTPGGYTMAESMFDGVDAILFPQMVATPTLPDGSRPDLVGQACAVARRRGLKVIYSADDYLERIEPDNPAFERIRDSIENIDTILHHAHAIFVTTPVLERSFEKYDKPVHLLPNAIDPGRWKRRPGNSGELRAGWAGSSSHIADLLMILPAVRRLQKRIPFRFVLQGLVQRPIVEEAAEVRRMRPGLNASGRATADAFLELAAGLETIRHIHVPFTAMESYLDLLPGLDLDVGLCPLRNTAFNRHKSCLKFYEYAACGTMTIASHVVPYRDEVSVTVPNGEGEWLDSLELYLRDPQRRHAELEIQRAFVLAERNIRRLRHRWAEALGRTLDVQEQRSLVHAHR